MTHFEKIFASDKIPKEERVRRTLNYQPVDRVALHDQVSFNPGVIELYTGKKISDFNYTEDDICTVIRKTLDMCFLPVTPRGKEKICNDGIVIQNDEWTSWIAERPFHDEKGAGEWLRKKLAKLKTEKFDADAERNLFRNRIDGIKAKIGDTVLCYYHSFGFCHVWDVMGIDLFSFFNYDSPEVMEEFLELNETRTLKWIEAVAGLKFSPVILIAEDFATKQGPLFGPDIMDKYYYPHLKALTGKWHSYGYKVLCHSDGNWKKVIPELIASGIDGFYCLEPSCGMDIVELKAQYPEMVWAGGLDGVDLMERGTPAQVRTEVIRHISGTDVLQAGGMFLGSSSEINPPIKPENFKAMIDTAGEYRNQDFI
jgi:hypothetical protein